MSIHHTQKTKYAKMKEAGLTAEELKKEMVGASLAEADVDQFIAELYAAEPVGNTGDGGEQAPAIQANVATPAVTQDTTTTPPPATPVMPVKPVFSYKNLTGEEWKRYQEHVASLPWSNLIDFAQYKAEEVRQERYPGLPGSPWDTVGIRIINDTPINTTRITTQTAAELNKQLPNSRRIYLLKQ